MAWDSKPGRRRGNSTATGNARRAPAPQLSVQPVSAHVADPFLHPFLNPSFDAAAYLNATLPPLASSARPPQGSIPLAELSIQAQSSISQLNAHTTRLSNTLTQLTDDILRSGSRLAYEVELLRGETLGLSEALTEGLQDDIAKFLPDGLPDSSPADAPRSPAHQRRMSLVAAAAVAAETPALAPTTTTDDTSASDNKTATVPDEPPYISQLRTLTLVRSRLDSVIKTFGDAMEFVFPPSEVSVSSSFLSVSAPDAGGENHSTEEKGQQVLRALREEISSLLKNPDPVKGIEDAACRIEELKELSGVWKGTAEEKGRAKFIDGLAKMVEDKHKELLRETEQVAKKDTGRAEAESSARKSGESERGQAENKGGGYGLISSLQKFRSGM